MKSRLSIVLALVGLLALPAAAQARRAPVEFFGISPQSPPNEADYSLMEQAGVRSLRLPLQWAAIEPVRPYVKRPDWSAFDYAVGLAARYGMRVLPFAGTSPPWIAPKPHLEPSAYGWQRRAWASFLRLAVRRYGSGGSFWREHPVLPYLPVHAWEIWNEENIVTFGRANPERFAALLRISGRVIHHANPDAKVILGGLFGRPLQIPPNVASADFLQRIYRARRVKASFDGVALHPYVADAIAMRSQIRNLRRVMRVHHDGATPLYLTELGWGSASYQTRWERGLRGQARELDQAFSMLLRHHRSWRIGGVWWFSWADGRGGCQFCDSSGLLTEDREAKPSWYRFNFWTKGDAETVPRAVIE
jgi:hypothetical protein